MAGPRRPHIGVPRARRCGHRVRLRAPSRCRSPAPTDPTWWFAWAVRRRRGCSPNGSSPRGAPVVQVGGPGVIDPDHNVVARIDDIEALTDARQAVRRHRRGSTTGSAPRPPPKPPSSEVLDPRRPARLTEPAVARIVATQRPPGTTVVVASSMPVRDYEWYGGPSAAGFSNRGANGIDGVVSTALGIALSGRTVVALVGDIAFVHDAGALTALRHRGVDLRIVVVDNDGGGIFSFLPQATTLDGKPLRTALRHPARHRRRGPGPGPRTRRRAPSTAPEALVTPAPGARSPRDPGGRRDRAGNVAVHAAIHDAVAAAL